MSKPDGGRELDDTLPASEPPPTTDEDVRARQPVAAQRYELGVELGRGGMGRVVEAYDTQLGRTVALKEVLPKGEAVERRFVREIQITARLEHASIVPLYDSGTTADGRPFYVMRRVSGRPLDELIRRTRDLGDRLILLPAVLSAIDAVAHAHRRGVVHRDLKPANILVGELGETVVIDWGLAKVIGEDEEAEAGDATKARVPSSADSLQTQLGAVFGTPGFMAPEQARGEALGPRTDVYALGATLYQLLTGAPPHAGSSATEVLGRTLKHELVPLATAAPGVPPELVAIVDKALAFDATTRYSDAGALGEDLRRFLAGQLVAAHRYTPQQRLVRFARRHRGSLTIGALAAVTLALVAWLSVSRVLTERDAANTARHAAVLDKLEAEHARDRLAERNDALIVTQARALLDSDPTEALATLKLLDPRSPRAADARAIGQAAVTRGVWSALQSTKDITTLASISLDGRQLFQITRNGTREHLVVWDLEARRQVLLRELAPPTRAAWVTGDRLLLYDGKTAPQLLDPRTGVISPLALPSIVDLAVAETGDRLVVIDGAHHASVIEVATWSVTALWDGRAVTQVEIAGDGSWVAVADANLLVVIDRAGVTRTQHARSAGAAPGTRMRMFPSDGHHLAVIEGARVFECDLTKAVPAWRDAEVTLPGNHQIIDLAYRGTAPLLYLTTNEVVLWDGATQIRRAALGPFSYRLSRAGDDLVVIPSTRGKLFVDGAALQMTLQLPTSNSTLRVASRAHASRIAVVGDGEILTLDLATISPRMYPAEFGRQVVFFDDDTLLSWRNGYEGWRWIDLRTGAIRDTKPTAMMMPMVLDLDPVNGRVLVLEAGGPAIRTTVLRKDGSSEEVVKGADSWARLIPRDAVLFGAGDGRVLAKIGAEPAHEVVKLDGHVTSACALGPLAFAAVSDQGELVRGNLANGVVERTRVTAVRGAFLVGEPLGRALLAQGDELSIWDHDQIVPIRRFDKQIKRLDVSEHGVLVTLEDNEMFVVDDLATGASRRLFTESAHQPISGAAGRLVVRQGNGDQLAVVELPSLARWTVPVRYEADDTLAIALGARRVVQASGWGLVEIELPLAGPDLASWLEEQTNATKSNDLLTWPWQLARP